MKVMYKFLDKLLANPTKLNILVLNKILTVGIPFNAPHGFKIKSLSSEAVVVALPNRKLNHNHLGGIHACAMATVGEYCAGLSLLTTFGISKYRLIMSELNVKYIYQGRVKLKGICLAGQIDVENVKSKLEAEGKFSQTLVTTIRDLQGKEIAEVTTTWQLKNWDAVKTKS